MTKTLRCKVAMLAALSQIATLSVIVKAEDSTAPIPPGFTVISASPDPSVLNVQTCTLTAPTESTCEVIGTMTVQQAEKFADKIWWRAFKRSVGFDSAAAVVVVGGVVIGAYLGAAGIGFIAGSGMMASGGGSFASTAFTLLGGVAGMGFGAVGGAAVSDKLIEGVSYVFSIAQTTNDLWQIEQQIKISIASGKPMILRDDGSESKLLLSLLEKSGMTPVTTAGLAPLN